ncbi:MAG: hypothetical protein EPN69_15835 [Rhodanobacter sp.]|nr:MAG: hypothetical protein EPN69_15835 [Rhodanobacter sp.]TAM01542.1 MAG: hypothetical protein EPN71_05490 [Rhodanobacter sp.]TAM38655.1 MAG: hypothetical protein EPN58_16325 [Rhodanobacter sp.]TAN23680.1 MAG: hypothetical protein EPN32_10900 [Rhodanobacter sp.]
MIACVRAIRVRRYVDMIVAPLEVWFDGGIRSGQDVLKALALGAHATLIGRAYVYGLGALGEAGVTTALELIRRELELTMVLCGVRDVSGIGRSALQFAKGRAMGLGDST